MLREAGETAVHVDLGVSRAVRPAVVGPPAVHRLHPGLDNVEAVEETCDLAAGADRGGDALAPVDINDALDILGCEVRSDVGERQIAAGGKRVEVPADDAVRVVGVRDEVQQSAMTDSATGRVRSNVSRSSAEARIFSGSRRSASR